MSPVDASLFLREVLVRCPGCGAAARAACDPPISPSEWQSIGWADRVWAPRRLACAACGLATAWPGHGPPDVRWHDPDRDPFFGAPLLLVALGAGGPIRAYNCVHLASLRAAAIEGERHRDVAVIDRLSASVAPG